MEQAKQLIFEEIDGLLVSAEPGLISASLGRDLPVAMHLHARPEECSLHNTGDPTDDTSALHFSCYGYIRIPNYLADQLIGLGVKDCRESK